MSPRLPRPLRRATPYMERIVFFVLAGVILLLLRLNVHRLRQEPARPLGRMTSQQALDRSEHFCHIIAPQTNARYLSVDSSKGPHGAFWIVSSQDRFDRELAVLTWDAADAELYRVSCWPLFQKSEGEAKKRPALSATAAIKRTRFWLSALGILHTASAWHSYDASVGPLRPNGTSGQSWSVKWEGEGRRAAVVIDARSGALLDLNVRHGSLGEIAPPWTALSESVP